MSDAARLLAEDAAARRRAQTDFATPLVVEAGAGSGKTSILVARIVAWALGPGWERAERFLRERDGTAPDERVASRVLSRVVAITFTDAAAAEMATRVGEWLGEIAAGETPRQIEPGVLPEPELCRRRGAPLRAALDRLVVRTIHAFCRRLLAEHPLEVGLHPAFEVDADEERSAAVVREVLEQAIPRAYADPASPLARLAAQGRGPASVEEALLALVQAGAPAELLEADPLAPERVGALRERLAEACASFQATERGRMAMARGSRVHATLDSVAATSAWSQGPGARVTEASALVADLRGLWEDKSVEALAGWAGGDLPKSADPGLGEDEAFLRAAALLHRRVRHALALEPEALDLSRRALAPLLRETEDRLRAAGIETFAALLRDASRLVASDPALAARIRRGIDHLLVDEFQDTDALQCGIVGRLGLGEGEGPTLFLVGDPRQSIYGWRSADLRAYDEFVGRLQAAGGERLRLARNFRSLPAVLAEVKRTIERHMQAEPGVQPAFQDLVPDRADAPGEVEHWVSWEWDAAQGAPGRTRTRAAALLEARALASDVARRAREEGVPFRDVAVLFRGMTDVDVYLDALRDAGVPYTVERDRRYYQRREVIEASALLRTVLDPHDHVALVAWLRSASVGVPDAAWTPLWTRHFPAALSELREPAAEALARVRGIVAEAAAAVDPALPGLDRVAGWERSLADAVETLAALRKAAREEPADRFVERLRTATLVEVTEASRYLGAYRVANLDQFFRDVRSHLEETGGDVAELLRRVRRAVEQQAEMEEARPREAADDAVRVMSIHKAKGLDFPHVYLMQLHKGQARNGKDGTRVGRGADGEEYELFGARTLGFDTAGEQAARTEEAERVRTLYVAMTRARDRLVVSGKHPAKGDSLGESHAELLAPRRSEPLAPELRMARLAASNEAAGRDEDGVLWRFPALAPAAARHARARRADLVLPEPAELLAASRALHERRGAAALHAQRPWSEAASKRSHEAVLERLHAERFPEDEAGRGAPGEREPRDAALGRAIGTAVHAALERWDANRAPAGSLDAARRTVEAVLPALVSPADLAEAVTGACEVLAAFAASPLHARLREIAPHVLARELPVLLPPGSGDTAVGPVVGTIDLLYREPATGEWVVADYKSDDVRSPADLRERAARYTAQGGAYVRAVHEGLGLAAPPRFELWFLVSGERIAV
jgi:ATP-dependent helicase/nuclease subunit A